MSNKKNLMFALLFIFAITLFVRLTVVRPKQIHVPLKYKSSEKISPKDEYANLNMPELKLDQLNKPKIKYQENTKNIFKSIIIPPVKHKPAPAPVTAAPRPALPVPKRNPLEDELKKIQFIGFSESKGKISVFLAKGDNLFVVSKGEKIEDKFIVKNITQTDVVLTIIDQTDIEFKINLKEEQEQPPISYPEVDEPEIVEEIPVIPEEPPENPPIQPVLDPIHRRPMMPPDKE